ncbi:MAG TPA: zinc-dependent metalloprotease family protein [Rubricoccaceae bacterium]|jgi:hypothetical protein
MSFVSPLCRLGLLAAAVLVALPAVQAQNLGDALWSDASEASFTSTGPRTSVPAAYRSLRLDRQGMAALLARTSTGPVEVPVPSPDGSTVWFRVVESSIMAPELQAEYPEIRTYVGQGRDVPSATVRLSLTPAGFAAMAFTPEGTIYVDPYAVGNAADYIAYFGRDVVATEAQRAALSAEQVEDLTDETAPARVAPSTSNGANLRTYRLALAATGEYTAFHGGTVAQALAAQVVAMNRVNQVYERDLSVTMQIIANNDLLIFTDPATDPYTNGGNSTLLAENQATVDARIGAANYDIGHVFETGGGGVAGLGVVCRAGQKARGETGLPNPTGDAFYIDFVAHEMGHQFRGNHTFNGSGGNCAGGNRSGSTAYEPGSGSTVMAYAGICGNNDLQTFSDPYFHAISLFEIVGYVTTGAGSTCGTVTPTNNDIPVVTATGGYVLPVRTPFVLTGAAADATPAALTYTWEEFDLGPVAGPPANGGTPTTVGFPFFRSYNPTPSPSRYFPALDRQLLNQTPRRGEALPIDARTLNFRLTARDNRAGGGAISDANVIVSTDAAAGPFAVTAPNTANLSFLGGSTQTVTWDVANTDVLDATTTLPDADGVDVENVQILYSTNGGTAFDIVLAASTPNDGSAEVVLPVTQTAQGRIMIAAVGNVFYDINNLNFAVAGFVANEEQATSAVGLSAVAPNPATGRASFVLRSASTESVTVAVYDALGREVARLHEGPVGVEQPFTVDVSRLPAGVYVVRASGGAVQSAQRFTVVR